MEMALLDLPYNPYAVQHLGHGLHPERGGRVPYRRVGHARPLRYQVEHVVPVPNALRAGKTINNGLIQYYTFFLQFQNTNKQ